MNPTNEQIEERMAVYCCGFVFDTERNNVLLIEKNRPAWQRGKLNGIGGHLENGEKPVNAMIRECKEETGLVIVRSWHKLCVLTGIDWQVHFFWATSDLSEIGRLHGVLVDEGRLAIVPTRAFPDNCIRNLRWLIPMALSGDTEMPYDIQSVGG